MCLANIILYSFKLVFIAYFRGRGVAAGFAAGVSYLMGFVATLLFLPLVDLLTLQGAFIIFLIFSFSGSVYMYFKLPETEGRSLEQIENFFKTNKFVNS